MSNVDYEIYIPTMNRLDKLARVVPRWLEDQIMRVVLVVEPDEYYKHTDFRDKMGWNGAVKVVGVPQPGKGIGYARRFCVLHAESYGLKSIIMTDDDIRPSLNGGDMQLLLSAARTRGVLGVGAVRRIHDHFTGGAVSRNHGVIMCPGGWGLQLFGLNVMTAIQLGNFDEQLHSYGEDGELERQGIANGIPWRVHCDIWCEPVGKRYDPGGISNRYIDRQARTQGEIECLRIIHERWPDYTNPPDKPLRVAWQKMLDDYIPNWRSRSAMHGGHL